MSIKKKGCFGSPFKNVGNFNLKDARPLKDFSQGLSCVDKGNANFL